MKKLRLRNPRAGSSTQMRDQELETPPAVCDRASGATAVVLRGSEWYWFQTDDHEQFWADHAASEAARKCRVEEAGGKFRPRKPEQPPGNPMVYAREFAEGGTLLVVLETKNTPAACAVTIHWPWQNILAGELQFAQIMETIFGNVAERGFDVAQPQLPLQIGEPQPAARPLPTSLRLPEYQAKSFVVNLDLGRTFFCTEALQTPEDAVGCGKPIACVHLANSRVQYTMTSGAARLDVYQVQCSRLRCGLHRNMTCTTGAELALLKTTHSANMQVDVSTSWSPAGASISAT